MAMLTDKVALVTGAGAGIGRATALKFSEEGAKVVVADLHVAGGEETAELIRKQGGEAVFTRADVTDATAVDALIRTAVDTYGRLDCACNNAGIEGAVVVADALAEPISDREQGVLELIARGLSNQEIADKLHISLHTVKTHARRINAKLEVKSRTQAIVRARELGLL